MKTLLSACTLLLLPALPITALEAPSKPAPLAPQKAPSAPVVPESASPSLESPTAKPSNAAPQKNKPYLGVGLDPVPDALAKHLGLNKGSGALIRVVDPSGPAATAGLQEADIIVAINGNPVQCQNSLCAVMENLQPGQKIEVSYLHRGKPQQVSLELAGRETADSLIPTPDDSARATDDMLRQLPQEMRDAIEKNLQALEGLGAMRGGALGGGGGVIPQAQQLIPELQKRIEKMMQGMPLPPDLGDLQAEGEAELNDEGIHMQSTLKMMDEEGNIEVQRNSDSTEAKVFDKQGKLLWSGPYHTPQDKAGVPPKIRERLDALNIDTSGNGIQLRMLPRR